MNDVTGEELNVGDWIAISVNVSTSSQEIRFGLVTKVAGKRVYFITKRELLDDYVERYMSNNKAIIKICRDMIPTDLSDGIIEHIVSIK